MAVSDVLSEDAITARLHDLLTRARVIKRSTSIDPALQVSALIREDEPLLACAKSEEEARNFIVEGAAKSIFYAILVCCTSPRLVHMLTTDRAQATLKIPPLSQYGICWTYSSIGVTEVSPNYSMRLDPSNHPDLCSPQLVLILLEELLDSLSIDRCRIALGFLESRREVLIAVSSP